MSGKIIISAIVFTFFAVSACDDGVKNTASCGDGFVDPGEECDGDVGEATCGSLGHYNIGGTLSCRADCLYDRTGCGGRCGDGVIDDGFGEVCDGANLNASCGDLGWHGGTLACAADCAGYDEGGCEDAGRCGDGVVQTEFEDCEDGDLGGATCQDQGFYLGTLACGADCRFDTTGCAERCGDGVIQSGEGEACDGSDLDGQTCESLGLHDGTLACDGACGFDTTGCGGACGDGVIQGQFGEQCEGADLDGQTCASLGHHQGQLTCDAGCQFVVDDCERCGDGIVQGAFGELCDGSDLNGGTCFDVGLFFGVPVCAAGCMGYDTGTCADLLQWGSTNSETVSDLAVDATGHVIVVGWTGGAIDGQSNAGATDIFVTRFAPDGRKLWTRAWGGLNGELAWAVATDDNGAIYVAGRTESPLHGNTLNGYNDAFLMKIDSDGTRQWTRQWGSVSIEDGHGVAVNGPGTVIYLAGVTGGALDGLPHSSGDDVFLTQFDADGNPLWTRLWGSGGYHELKDIALDASGNVYLTGKANGSLNSVTSAGGNDAFLMKVDAAGTMLWTRLWGTAGSDYGNGLVLNAAGDVLVTGVTEGSLDGEPYAGGTDIFLTAWTADGARLWTTQWGTTGDDGGNALALDGAGGYIVAGTTFGDLEGQINSGTRDAFVTRLDVDGAPLATRLQGTVQWDSAKAIAVNTAGKAFVAGETDGAFPGQTSAGSSDAILWYLD